VLIEAVDAEGAKERPTDGRPKNPGVVDALADAVREHRSFTNYVTFGDSKTDRPPRAPCPSWEACEGSGRCLAEPGTCSSAEGRMRDERNAGRERG
jgi:hypothetical protein